MGMYVPACACVRVRVRVQAGRQAGRQDVNFCRSGSGSWVGWGEIVGGITCSVLIFGSSFVATKTR